MEKIPTLFRRDDLTRKVNAEMVLDLRRLIGATVTEKVDGTNVRLTVRSGELVRVEARRNPPPPMKARGVVEPWYRDAWTLGTDPKVGGADKYIVEAAENTALGHVEDGEWSGEAVGPSIQGNPLELEQREVILFSHWPTLHARLTFAPDHAPRGVELADLEQWMRGTDSIVSPGHPIEGIVFWQNLPNHAFMPIAKLKLRDLA